jgi:TolB-like protein
MASCRIIAISVVGICITGLVAGCGANVAVVQKEQINLVNTSYRAVDEMLGKSRASVGRDAPIIVATFVDLDDVTRTSALGRVMGEICAARLSQRGYRVINVKVRPDSVVINPQGEFLLSRDVNVVSKEHGAQVVLVGTYTKTDVREKLRSVNQKLETIDSELLMRASYLVGEPRVFETIDDSVYISLRLVSAKDHSIMAAHDYRIVCDENIESLMFQSQDDSTARY